MNMVVSANDSSRRRSVGDRKVFVQLADGRVGQVLRFTRGRAGQGQAVSFKQINADADETIALKSVKFIFINKQEARTTAAERAVQASLVEEIRDLPPEDVIARASQQEQRFTPAPQVLRISPAEEARQKAEQIRQQTERFEQETAERTFARQTPLERTITKTSAIISPRGEEALGASVLSLFGEDEPFKQVGIKQVRAQQKATREGKEFEFALESGVFNPITETVALTTGGGFAIGAVSRTAKGARIFGSKAGKVIFGGATGAFTGKQAIDIVGDPTPRSIGGGIVTGATLFGIGRRASTLKGERFGFAKFEAPREASKLFKAGKITEPEAKIIKAGAKGVFGIEKTGKVRPLEDVLITRGGRSGLERVPRREQRRVLAEIRSQRGTIFGSFAQEAQFPAGKARAAKDIDVIVGTEAGKKSLEKVTGQSLGLDIKVRGTEREKEFQKFLFKESETGIGGIKITSLREQFGRKLFGSIDPQRLERKGKQEIIDVGRILKLQASGKIARGKKLSKAEKEIFDIELPKQPRTRKGGKAPSSIFGLRRRPPSSFLGARRGASSIFGRRTPSRPTGLRSRLDTTPSKPRGFLTRSRLGTRPRRFVSPLFGSPSRPRPSRTSRSILGTPSRPRSSFGKAISPRPSQVRFSFDNGRKPRRLGRRKVPRQPKRFTPSVTAGILGITGKQPKTVTGFGIRPLPKGKRKRRKSIFAL